MRKTLLLALAAMAIGCASLGGAKHVVIVTETGIHATLSMVKSTEAAMVCGRATAPAAPQCVPQDVHQFILQKLSKAFELEIDVAHVVHDLPIDQPRPDNVLNELAQVGRLVSDILTLLPSGNGKAELIKSLAKQGGN